MNPKFPAKSPISTEVRNAKASKLQHLRRYSHFLDSAFRVPGTRYRFGLDPIIGLIPGGGDVVGGLLSAYIFFHALQLGVPKGTLLRMVSNIMIDILVGTVPVMGDLFDAAWKANIKNVDLLEVYINSPETGQKADRLFIILLVGGLMLFLLVIAILGITILTFIYQVLSFVLTGG